MNSKVRKHFEGRFERLDPRIVQVFLPGEGWKNLVHEAPVTAEQLRRFAATDYTHVGVSPVPVERPTIADFSIRELLDVAVPAERIERKGRPALTKHQRALFLDLIRRSEARRGPVPLSEIGSRSGMAYLVAKGYALRSTSYGPRGGAHYSYEPIR